MRRLPLSKIALPPLFKLTTFVAEPSANAQRWSLKLEAARAGATASPINAKADAKPAATLLLNVFSLINFSLL